MPLSSMEINQRVFVPQQCLQEEKVWTNITPTWARRDFPLLWRRTLEFLDLSCFVLPFLSVFVCEWSQLSLHTGDPQELWQNHVEFVQTILSLISFHLRHWLQEKKPKIFFFSVRNISLLKLHNNFYIWACQRPGVQGMVSDILFSFWRHLPLPHPCWFSDRVEHWGWFAPPIVKLLKRLNP